MRSAGSMALLEIPSLEAENRGSPVFLVTPTYSSTHTEQIRVQLSWVFTVLLRLSRFPGIDGFPFSFCPLGNFLRLYMLCFIISPIMVVLLGRGSMELLIPPF